MSNNGDLIKILKSNSNVWVANPINTKGAMGAGLAKQFRDNFPKHYTNYRQAVARGEVQVGKMFVDAEHKIVGFPTKNHWKYPSKVEYIEHGLKDLSKRIHAGEIDRIILPRLGSGYGGLHFENQVLPLIKKELGSVAKKVAISSEGTITGL